MAITFLLQWPCCLLQWPNQDTKNGEIDICLQGREKDHGRNDINFLHESSQGQYSKINPEPQASMLFHTTFTR